MLFRKMNEKTAGKEDGGRTRQTATSPRSERRDVSAASTAKAERDALSPAATVAFACLAGLVSGVFGALGGVAVMYICARANPPKTPSAVRDNYALTLAVVLAVSAVSAVAYAVRGDVDYVAAAPAILPAAAGGVTGAVLCDRLPASALRLIFAALTVWAGARMIGG